jgi:hypothetical protein
MFWKGFVFLEGGDTGELAVCLGLRDGTYECGDTEYALPDVCELDLRDAHLPCPRRPAIGDASAAEGTGDDLVSETYAFFLQWYAV